MCAECEMSIMNISLNTQSVTGGTVWEAVEPVTIGTVWEAAEPSWSGASLQGAGKYRKVLGCVFSTGSSLPLPLACVGVSKPSLLFSVQ